MPNGIPRFGEQYSETLTQKVYFAVVLANNRREAKQIVSELRIPASRLGELKPADTYLGFEAEAPAESRFGVYTKPVNGFGRFGAREVHVAVIGPKDAKMTANLIAVAESWYAKHC
jgi:hypothetical protein